MKKEMIFVLLIMIISAVPVLTWSQGIPNRQPPDPAVWACLQKADVFVKQLVLDSYGPKSAIADFRTTTGMTGPKTIRVWLNVVTKESQLPMPPPPGYPSAVSATHYVGFLDFDADNCQKPNGKLNLAIVLPSSLD